MPENELCTHQASNLPLIYTTNPCLYSSHSQTTNLQKTSRPL